MINLHIKQTKISEVLYTQPTDFFQQHYFKDHSALLTGKGLADISRYSFIGISPHTIISYDDKFIIRDEDKVVEYESDFWKFQHRILASTQYHQQAYPANLCGGIGFYSYDVLHEIENIPIQENNYEMPKFKIVFYNEYFVFDNLDKKVWKIEFEYKRVSRIFDLEQYSDDYQVSNISAECNEDEYRAKVEKIKEYILAGDVYEVNLSQQIKAEFSGNPYQLFNKLYQINDAPFSGYLNFGEQKIICNSPEMFLQADGHMLQTRPIKGTIARSEDEDIDTRNRQILLNSSKDEAELFMIIDLLRNDIGKVCKYGSVKVLEEKRLEAYKNVYHLVGIISGMMKAEYDYIDLIKATFPGGSITGCPKVRCMEIIQELESFNRHLYTGSIFIMNQNYLNSNIVIRSGIICDDQIFFNSGGAITIDSDAKSEYEETQTKIKSLLQAVKSDGELLD